MDILIDGHTLTLLPRVAAMVRLVIENQREIEVHPAGCVFLDYAPTQVAISIKIKKGLAKVVDSERKTPVE